MSEVKRKSLSNILIVLVVLTLSFIWLNSFLPSDDSEVLSRGFLSDICNVIAKLGIYLDPTDDYWLRKLMHFSEFGALAGELCLLMYLYKGQGLQGFANCAFAGLATAVTDESIQLVSGRCSQVQDVLLDFSGFMTGLLLFGLICALFTRRYNKA